MMIKKKLMSKEVWFPILFAFLAGCIVHFALYANELVTPDGLWGSEFRAHYAWEISLGRWGLNLSGWLYGNVASHGFVSMIAIFIYAVSGQMLSTVLGIYNKIGIATLITMTIVCSPMVAMSLTYPYCSIDYALAFLLSIFSVVLLQELQRKVLAVALGAVCIMLALSIYQAVLGAALLTMVGAVILWLLEEPEQKWHILKEGLKYIITAGAGAILYWISVWIVQLIMKIGLSDFKGANSIGIVAIFQNLADSIFSTYKNFADFFLADAIAVNHYGAAIAYVIIAVAAILAIIRRFASLQGQASLIAIIVPLLAVIPIAANIIVIIVPGTLLYLLMASGMMIFVPILLAITQLNEPSQKPSKADAALRSVAAIMAAVLIWGYAITNQNDAAVLKSAKNQTSALANRIWTTIEAHENYQAGETSVLIAGAPEKGNYPNPSRLYDKANRYATWGLFWSDYNGANNCWQEVMRQYVGVDCNAITAEEYELLAQTNEFKTMPNYPAEGSVKSIDGVLVVKVAEATETD